MKPTGEWFLIAGIAAMAALAGCASLSFRPIVESNGGEGSLGAGHVLAEDLSDHDVAGIEIFEDSLPDGTFLVEGDLVVDPDRYAVVAHITAKPNHPMLAAFGFWPYHYVEGERWRDWYCTAQVPLAWVTLGLWSVLSPLHYPCIPLSGESAADVANRKRQLMLTMKKAARAAGGDFLIVTRTFSQHATFTDVVETGRARLVSTSSATFDAIAAVGFAVKRVQPRQANVGRSLATGAFP